MRSITAFGRIGTMFGSDRYGVQADIMVLSKQLTSSYQPLAAVVVSDAVHETLVEQSGRLGSFVHGFTTTGHPVATAVGAYVFRRAHDHGLIIRAIYDTIACCPPLIATDEDRAALLEAFSQTLDDATTWARTEGLA